MKEKILLIAFVLLPGLTGLVTAQNNIQKTVRVKIKIIEEDTRQITPAMVCITGVKDTLPRLPPYGDTAGAPTEVPLFMQGIKYKKDKNWVGPVRMTNGLGNNCLLYTSDAADERSSVDLGGRR